MRKKIIVLDSAGMAGHMIKEHLESYSDYEVVGVVFNKKNREYGHHIDLGKITSVIDFIDTENPDVVINAVRVLVEESKSSPSEAILINSYLPRMLEKAYLHTSTRIIHLSTDCVFSGEKGGYVEADVKDGKDMYARTRGLGELENDKDLTFRTSFIGPVLSEKPEELFDWFMMQHGTIKGFKNAFWTGVTTLELAKGIAEVIEKNISGIYHFVPETSISKYELLQLIKSIWDKHDVKVLPYENEPINKSLIDTRKELNVSEYNSMFHDLYLYMKENKEKYLKYN